MSCEGYPVLIQGGMGVGTSNWRLARAVAIAGQTHNIPVLGVVSGTGVEATLARKLQDGDPGGHVHRALAAFPLPQIAESILNEYSPDAKKPPTARYRLTPRPADLLNRDPRLRRAMNELSVAANFVEVWLAKEGHDRPIGINHLEKIQLLHLPRLYGAMLAGVDYVLEGAGIPDQVPGVLDRFAGLEQANYKVDVAGSRERVDVTFDPRELGELTPLFLKRPLFLAIIASNVLAKVLTTRASGYVDGFVVERPIAGGHNAPPRGKFELNSRGEPIYGEKDEVNLEQLADLQRPFWLAGGYASPAELLKAIASGAMGVQAGTVFALCEESGIAPELKKTLLQMVFDKTLDILTSSKVSPTGFPFKVAQVDGTLSEQATFKARTRRCTAGHLVKVYQTKRGTLGVRCPAEPVDAYVQKGGKREDAEGSACICNGLIALAEYGQIDRLGKEVPIVTLGDDLGSVSQMQTADKLSYSAEEVVLKLTEDYRAATASTKL